MVWEWSVSVIVFQNPTYVRLGKDNIEQTLNWCKHFDEKTVCHRGA